MASLPDDVERWIGRHFNAADAPTARSLLQQAVDHKGTPATERLLRCAAIGSQGDLEQLKYLVGLMQIDYRDVIVAGEYEVRDGKLARVRNLDEPLN